MTPATNAAAQPQPMDDDDDDSGALLERRMSAHQSITHEAFLETLDAELKKMDAFAHAQVADGVSPRSCSTPLQRVSWVQKKLPISRSRLRNMGL